MNKIKPWAMRTHLNDNDCLLHSNSILDTDAVPLADYLSELEEMKFEKTCHEHKIELITVMELGTLGEIILDPDDYARRSMVYILNIAPYIMI
jgi:hypothetical protein